MHLGLCVSVSCPEVTPTNHTLLTPGVGSRLGEDRHERASRGDMAECRIFKGGIINWGLHKLCRMLWVQPQRL